MVDPDILFRSDRWIDGAPRQGLEQRRSWPRYQHLLHGLGGPFRGGSP